MGKYFTEDSEIVEKEISGDIWKFRILEAGKISRMTSKYYDKFTEEVDGAGYVEELLEKCIVEVPEEFKEEFKTVRGKEWEGTRKDIQKLPPALYAKLAEIVTEIHGLSINEKNY